jgi:hypothetical protein
MFTSYDLQDDKGIPFDEVKIKDVLSKEGFDEVEMKDNTVELKRVIDEYEKSKSVAESKNTMKYIKTFESFTDFIKDPTGKKRAAVAAEEELDKYNRDSEDSAKKAESSNETQRKWSDVKLYKVNENVKKFYDKLSSKEIEVIDGDEKYIYVTSNGNDWLLKDEDKETDTYKKSLRKEELEKLLSERNVKISIV